MYVESLMQRYVRDTFFGRNSLQSAAPDSTEAAVGAC